PRRGHPGRSLDRQRRAFASERALLPDGPAVALERRAVPHRAARCRRPPGGAGQRAPLRRRPRLRRRRQRAGNRGPAAGQRAAWRAPLPLRLHGRCALWRRRRDADAGGSFNVGTGVETDINTIFQTLKRLTGSTEPEEHGPPLPGEQRRSVVDARKIEKTLGWQPKTSLDAGLDATVRYFREARPAS